MQLIAETANRVEKNTSDAINDRIAEAARLRVADIGNDLDAINARLKDLDREWDIERAIEVNASTLIVAGAVLALMVDKRFAWVPAIVGGFLFQHAIQGWCPPVPALRRLGFRTSREIEKERAALIAKL